MAQNSCAALGRQQPHTNATESLTVQLPEAAGFSHHAAPHPPQLSPRPWKACPSPSSRRASAMSLLVLSEEERAELDDCFDALAGAPTGVIGIKHIAKAMELVLGPEHSSEKEAKAALDAMGPNISGNVDKAAFRAYMINNWVLAAAPAAEGAGRRRSAQGFDVGAMRPSDIVRMYRRQTLGERTLKKAQEQVQMMMQHGRAGSGDGKAAAAGQGSSKEAAGNDPWSFQDRRRSFDHGPRPPMEPGGPPSARRTSKRSFDSAVEVQRAGARAPGGQAAVVPLSRFRRASMLLLEAALANEKQLTQLTGSMSSMELPAEQEPEPEPEPAYSMHEDQTVHEAPADAAAQLAWEQRVLSLCCLDSAHGSREDWADFLPVQQLLLSPQPPGTPDQPQGPREGGSLSSSEPQAAIEPAFSAPQLSSFSTDQITDAAACEPVPVSVKSGFSIASESGAGASKHHHYSVHFTGSSSMQPPDVAQSLRALGQQPSMSTGGGGWQQGSPSALPFDAFASDCSGSSYDSNDESDADSEACEVPPSGSGSGSGSTGGVTSWVAKRLTRFASRDEMARADEPQLVPRGPSACLISTLGMRRSSLTMQRSSELLGTPPAPRAGEQEGRQCTMPQPGGAGVESMLRRVGHSQRGLLPSVGQGSQAAQASAAAYNALGSRSGMQVPSHMAVPVVAKARSSFLGVPRTDKAIADLHAKMTQKSNKKHERWNLA